MQTYTIYIVDIIGQVSCDWSEQQIAFKKLYEPLFEEVEGGRAAESSCKKQCECITSAAK